MHAFEPATNELGIEGQKTKSGIKTRNQQKITKVTKMPASRSQFLLRCLRCLLLNALFRCPAPAELSARVIARLEAGLQLAGFDGTESLKTGVFDFVKTCK
jgi:hypothetical protein